MRNKIRITLHSGRDGPDTKASMTTLLGSNVGGGKGVDTEYVIINCLLNYTFILSVRRNFKMMMTKRLHYRQIK